MGEKKKRVQVGKHGAREAGSHQPTNLCCCTARQVAHVLEVAGPGYKAAVNFPPWRLRKDKLERNKRNIERDDEKN